MNRRSWIIATAISSSLPGRMQAAPAKNSQQPNIILILTDDQGYGDVGRHGNPVLKTPNMDRLHDESVRFTDCQVSPCCAPTRCALMTGMHEFKSGVTHTIEPFRRMNLTSTTLPQVLKTVGYTTGMFGKWHLGHSGDYRPDRRGFDVGVMAKGDSQKSHFDPTLIRNGVEEKHQGYRTDIIYGEAMKFIEENKAGPFFCYLPSYSPHSPCKAPEEDTAPYTEYGGTVGGFFGMVANVDKNIGRLLAQLEQLGIDGNTLIIFMNDNGGTMGVDTWNANMRGIKGTPWFGGTRAISFWRWPNQLKPATIEHLTAHLDVLPTLADIAGASLSADHQQKLDGVSLRPLLNHPNANWPAKNRVLFTNVARWSSNVKIEDHAQRFAGIRKGKYHLVTNHQCADPKCKHKKCKDIRNAEAGKARSMYSAKNAAFHFALTPANSWALFDLEKDPSQNINIAEQHPELVQELQAQYEQWWNEVRPQMIHNP